MLKQHCSTTNFSGNTNVIPLTRRRTLGGCRTTALAIALALVLLAFGTKLDLAGSRSSAAPWTAETPYAIREPVYFPGQYVNQASEPAQHIQAF
jgi:hypothetical protein